MAPLVKSKLSQTRLKTPQKPSLRPSFSATKGAGLKSKTKSKPNQSILSYFKKAPAPDDGLFIGECGPTQACDSHEEIEEANFDGDCEAEDGQEGIEEKDINASTSSDPTISGAGDDVRYNEVGGALKRRRLSPLSTAETRAEESNSTSGADLSEDAKAAAAPLKTNINTPTAPKRKAGIPFLEDSSDDEDDKENDPTVRPPQPASAELHNGRDGGPEPVKLTKEEGVSREAPLLSQQTSKADPGSNDRICGGPEKNAADNAEDTLLEDQDFTGEELKAMLYMEEQARREAEEGLEYEANEFANDETMTESCPVCNGILAGTTPDEATAHVNSCLDGSPTPLPKPVIDLGETEATLVGKRFAKAAIARPGQANPITLADNTGDGKSNSAFTKLMSGHAEDAAWATAAAAEVASRGMPAYKRTCPFYKIMPGFFICVDAFRYGAVEGCKAYFLSHFHSDHYMGLTANWTHGPIYCSKVTGSLVKSQLKTAAKYVVELEFEETVLIPDTNGVTVTMIPANHCPGSSLFLFEKNSAGKTHRILHCGDFRACPAHVEHPKLRPETVDAISGRTRQQKIDVCYLDTTYLNPRYSFPLQDDVITACADLCALLNKSLLADDDHEWEALLRRQRGGGSSNTRDVSKFFTVASSPAPTKPTPPQTDTNAFTALNDRRYHPNRLLVVCGTYSIGKERICVAIAQAMQTKIYATPAKIRMCKQLDDPELSSLLTSNPAEAQVHMQMLMEIRAETLVDYLEGYKARGEFGRIVGFRPSGWNYRPSSSSAGTAKPGNGVGSNNSTTIGANLPPTSLPTTQLLHGPSWKTHFARSDLIPQRGSSREALCFGAPYSEHSSFRELALFVMALRIERVVPTVNVGSEASRRRMRGWVDRWLSERRRGGLVKVLSSQGEEEGKVDLWDGKDGRGGGVYW